MEEKIEDGGKEGGWREEGDEVRYWISFSFYIYD